MLCCVVLCCVVLCCVVLCFVVLCCVVLCCVVLCCVVLCCVVLCCVVLRCVALRCVALRCVALRCVVLCCVVLCCVVLCCVVLCCVVLCCVVLCCVVLCCGVLCCVVLCCVVLCCVVLCCVVLCCVVLCCVVLCCVVLCCVVLCCVVQCCASQCSAVLCCVIDVFSFVMLRLLCACAGAEWPGDRPMDDAQMLSQFGDPDGPAMMDSTRGLRVVVVSVSTGGITLPKRAELQLSSQNVGNPHVGGARVRSAATTKEMLTYQTLPQGRAQSYRHVYWAIDHLLKELPRVFQVPSVICQQPSVSLLRLSYTLHLTTTRLSGSDGEVFFFAIQDRPQKNASRQFAITSDKSEGLSVTASTGFLEREVSTRWCLQRPFEWSSGAEWFAERY